jgi:hypothetical protein
LLEACGQELGDEDIIVPVDDEGWQPVCLTVHKAVCIRFWCKIATVLEGRRDARTPEHFIDGRVVYREHP